MVTLQYVPVDTVICFRASIPLVVAVLDYLLMGRELPTPRSWVALTGASSRAVLVHHGCLIPDDELGFFEHLGRVRLHGEPAEFAHLASAAASPHNSGAKIDHLKL